jgi:hypothetical protein
MRWAVPALAVLALCAPAAARADGLGMERVTTGPSGGNADLFTEMLVSSADGTRALFTSEEALTPDDDRLGADYYERVGQTTRMLAHDTGTDDPRISMGFYFASADATLIVFAGGGHWAAGDTDDMFSDDVYSAKNGVVEWVSQSGNADSFSAEPTAMSGDGNRIVFETSENLTADDTDFASRDIYVREGGVTTRLSPGNTDGYDAEVVGQSNDARRIVFRTPERLTAGDTDSEFDLYARSGGQTVKVSPGNGPYEARISGVSSDGGTVVFTTQDRLTADDTDSRADAYRLAGGSIARVSTGPRGGNSPDHPVGFEVNAVGGDVLFMSDDGTRVVFGTPEQMTADDTDQQFDSYLWTPSGVQKVTPGNGEVDPTGWDDAATVVGGTPDGSRLLFITREGLTGDDTDSHLDLYEWAAGTVRRVSTGPSGGNDASRDHLYCPPIVYDDYCGSLVYVSEDGARIVFETTERLAPADTDDKIDVYQRAGGVTTLLSPARPDRGAVYGERDSDVFFVDASLDGSIAYLESEEQLTADDTNVRKDGVRVHPPAPGTVVSGVSGVSGAAPAAAAAPVPASSAAPAKSAARLRLASRPRALRLARGKTRLARRGRGLALRLTATRALLIGTERIAAGRRDGATCRRPTRQLRRAPSCRRTVAAARPLRLVTTGSRAVLRLGRRSLKPGRHRIMLTPLDAAGRAGTPVRVTLRLKR